LLIYLSRYLDQKTAKYNLCSFRPNRQLLLLVKLIRGKDNLLSTLPKGTTTSDLAGLFSTLFITSMLNVKQGSCEYQLFKSFGMLDEGIEPKSTDYEVYALTTNKATKVTNKATKVTSNKATKVISVPSAVPDSHVHVNMLLKKCC